MLKLVKKYCIAFKVVFSRFKHRKFGFVYGSIKSSRNYNTSKIDFFNIIYLVNTIIFFTRTHNLRTCALIPIYKYYLCTLTGFCVFKRINKLFCCLIEK